MKNILLPEWAERHSDGTYMEVGAQLLTKDGRAIGNAVVKSVRKTKWGLMADIVTDKGNKSTMTKSELEERFYKPTLIISEVL